MQHAEHHTPMADIIDRLLDLDLDKGGMIDNESANIWELGNVEEKDVLVAGKKLVTLDSDIWYLVFAEVLTDSYNT